MSQTIHIGPGTDIDIGDMLQSRVIIQGNSGAGKSGLARKMMEESFGKVPFVVWDIEGEYYTLKELSGDIVVIGGLHGDVPITTSLAEKLPAFIIDNRLTVIVDLSDLKMSERVRFTRDFFETLMDLPLPYWTSYQFYLEECHKLAGEQDKQESSTAIKDLMQRGRKRGFCGIVLTQRIGMLSKSVSAECNNKFIGRTSQDIDMDRSGKELGFRKAADALQLRDLKRGHFFAFGPSMQPDHVHEVIVDKPKTTMVKAGMQVEFKAPKPTAKLLDMLAKLNEPEEKTAESGERNALPPSGEVGRGLWEAERQELEFQLSQTKAYVFEQQNEITSLTKKLADAKEVFKTTKELFEYFRDKSDNFLKVTDPNELSIEPQETPLIYEPAPAPDFKWRPDEKPATNNNHIQSLLRRDLGRLKTNSTPSKSGPLPTGEKRVLTAIAQFGKGLNRKALTIITGYTRRTRDAYIFGLRSKGYADLSGDKVVVTAAGIKILGPDFKRLPTGRRLRDYWLTELPQGERSILIYALDAGNNIKPTPVTRDYLSIKTGYTRRTRDAYIYNLKAKEIVKDAGKGQIQVSDFLFD